MTWFKVDDGFYTSRKVLSIPRTHRLAAVGLWTMAGTWCAGELNDGVVPGFVLAELGATPRLRQALIDARLWLDHPDGSIEFHSWDEYQPTREKVEENREKEREKKRLARERRSGVPRGVPEGHHGESLGESVLPDPTRPDPTVTTSSDEEVGPRKRAAAKRGSRIPEPFMLTPTMRAWAAEEVPGVDVERSTRMFVDYWRGVAGAKGVKLDWLATWKNWLRRDHEKVRPVRAGAFEAGLSLVERTAAMEQERGEIGA